MKSIVRFTVIIPHRDLPAHYLRRCLDSIPHEEDVQIIVVDDASDMAIVGVSHLPGEGEPCTEVVRLDTNHGPGYARNLALQKAKGEWIFFADADDYLQTDNLMCLMELLRNRQIPYECIYFGLSERDLSGNISLEQLGCTGTDILPLADTLRNRLFVDMHQSWRKTVKRSAIEQLHLHFAEIVMLEDILFSIRLLNETSHVGVFPPIIYCYERRASSTTQHRLVKTDIEGMNAVIDANRYFRQKSMPHRVSIGAKFLAQVRQDSYWQYMRLFLKEAFLVDWSTALHDRQMAIEGFLHRNPNPLLAWIQDMRVKVGRWRRRSK